MGWLRRLSNLVGVLLIAAVCAAGFAVHAVRTGADTRPAKVLAARLGTALRGQKAESLVLDVRVQPDERRLSGSAQWSVRAEDAARSRFYFFLDPALRVRGAKVDEAPRARVYQIGGVVAVDLRRPLAAGESAHIAIDYAGRPRLGSDGLLDARDVLLTPSHRWYPSDLRGTFDADVSITLPADYAVVHTGEPRGDARSGRVRRVRWSYARPVRGLALVAGRYGRIERHRDGVAYRIFVAEDIGLDPERLFQQLATARRSLADLFGPSGFPTLGLYVSRRSTASRNDGSGLIGLSLSSFRGGDRGFGAIAYGAAQSWWGATVLDDPFAGDSGGLWLTDGLAEMSRLLASAAHFGPEVLPTERAGLVFDAQDQRSLAELSAVDRFFAPRAAASLARTKGGAVALMLRDAVGEEAFTAAVRRFVHEHRREPVADGDLEEALAGADDGEVEGLFQALVRSPGSPDLSLDESEVGGGLVVRNLGEHPAPGAVDLWLFARAGGEPQRSTVAVGDLVQLPEGTDYAVVDPLGKWVDPRRSNNVFPRRLMPRFVAVSPTGVRAVVADSGGFWPQSQIRLSDGGGKTAETFDLERAVVAAPRWIDDRHLMLETRQTPGETAAVVALDTRSGAVEVLGRGSGAAVGGGGVYAARGSRLVRWAPGWKRESIWCRPGAVLGHPRPSPQADRVAYTASRASEVEIRLVRPASGEDALLFAAEGDLEALEWAADGASVYAVVGGEWDWRIWELPVDGSPPRSLMRDAAAVGGLAISPGGGRLAFSAASFDYPHNRKRVFVLDVESRSVDRVDVADGDAEQVVWADAGVLLAIARPAGETIPWHLPEQTRLVRIGVDGGTVEPVD